MYKNDSIESKEMYLESLLLLSKKNANPRAKDLADFMDFSKPSVSRALFNLESYNLIKRDKDAIIHLTEEGRCRAEKIYEKHIVLTEFLTELGVDDELAEKDACKIEHVISDETFVKIKKYIENRKNS